MIGFPVRSQSWQDTHSSTLRNHNLPFAFDLTRSQRLRRATPAHRNADGDLGIAAMNPSVHAAYVRFWTGCCSTRTPPRRRTGSLAFDSVLISRGPVVCGRFALRCLKATQTYIAYLASFHRPRDCREDGTALVGAPVEMPALSALKPLGRRACHGLRELVII